MLMDETLPTLKPAGGFQVATPSLSSRAPQACSVRLPPPERPGITLLDFLDERFPHVGREVWQDRLRDGKIRDQDGAPVTLETPYQTGRHLVYHREVPAEPRVPFEEAIVFQDENILVACKPHFLPVIPSGPYVNECLLYRLRERTGNPALVAVNRIDRETAGLVLFSVRAETRALYYDLFRRGAVRKIYEAVAELPGPLATRQWTVASRIEAGEPWFRSRNAPGEPNARTRIRLVEARGSLGRFELVPLTGKRHQLRLHLALIGCPIANDPLYPDLRPQPKDGFDAPLQLLARELQFADPVTRAPRHFHATRRLAWDAASPASLSPG